MGNATRWLKGLLGKKKEKENGGDNMSKCSDKKSNKRWSFCISEKYSAGNYNNNNNIEEMGSDSYWLRSLVAVTETEKEVENKNAIAVAAAAADAAVAAAQAAVAVVRMTNHGRSSLDYFNGIREKNAAVKIQAVFRGSLSRKALRALKGVVKLQAIVRGYLVRKRTAATLHSMQALFRAQVSVCSQRARLCTLSSSSSTIHCKKYPPLFRPRRSLEKIEDRRSSAYHSRRLSASYEYDEIPSPKIVEIDTCKQKSRSRRIHTCHSVSGDDHHYLPSLPSPFLCPNPPRLSIPDCGYHYENSDWNMMGDECVITKFATAQNTPRFMNTRISETPETPTKSASGDGLFRSYSNYPSYMANTQSFQAKSRSNSAPKQRLEIVMPTAGNRSSLNEMIASRLSFSGVRI